MDIDLTIAVDIKVVEHLYIGANMEWNELLLRHLGGSLIGGEVGDRNKSDG